MDGAMLEIDSIRFPGEKGAFIVLFSASIITLVVFAIILVKVPEAALVVAFYMGLFLFAGWLTKLLMLAAIRGNGIRVTADQYPQIHDHVLRFAARLGLTKIPEVYVIQGTIMNAFATKVIRRRYVVLYSHLVDAALESGDYDEVAMIVGHEMGHHAAGHVRWYGFLQLGCWIPFLYSYWSPSWRFPNGWRGCAPAWAGCSTPGTAPPRWRWP